MKRSANVAPRRRQARSRETRAAIIAAAERIFAKSGLAGARTEAIADAAGVNKALLYYYFKGKDNLFEAVVEEHLGEFNRQALQLLAEPGSARGILLRYVNLHFDFISAHHCSAPLFQQMMMANGKFLERLIEKYLSPRSAALHQLIHRGVRTREFRRVDPFNTTMSIVSLIVFYFSAARVLQVLGRTDAYTPANLKRRKREVLDFIRHALFVDPSFSLS